VAQPANRCDRVQVSFREQFERLISESMKGSAGAVARDVTGHRPTAEEMIDTLVQLADAHSKCLLLLADALDSF
jgi:hypothetical protein